MIVLISDHRSFSELKHCIESITDKNYIQCFDIGMTNVQTKWLNSQGIKTQQAKTPTISHSEKAKFLKPFVLNELPNGNYIYADVDLIFNHRFAPTQFDEFTIFKEPAPCRNPPILCFNSQEDDSYNCNSGFFYFEKPRDNWLLDEWCKLTLDIDLSLPKCFDQGILQHILEKHNWPVFTDHQINHNPIRDLLNPNLSVTNQIHEYQNQELISHFAGQPKLSQLHQINNETCIDQLNSCKPNHQKSRLIISTNNIASIRKIFKKHSAWFNNYYMTEDIRSDVHADILITEDNNLIELQHKYKSDINVIYRQIDQKQDSKTICIDPSINPELIIPIIKHHYDIPFRSELKTNIKPIENENCALYYTIRKYI